jgi:hypothetical protein
MFEFITLDTGVTMMSSRCCAGLAEHTLTLIRAALLTDGELWDGWTVQRKPPSPPIVHAWRNDREVQLFAGS